MLCQLFKKSRSRLTILQRNYMLSLMNETPMLLLRKTWKKGQNYGPSVKCDADALYSFQTSYPVVVHALKCFQNQGDDKAGQFLASIMWFQFNIIALVVAEHILHSTVYMSTFLQDTECDLLEAIKECKTVTWPNLLIYLKVCPVHSAILTHGHAGQLPGVPISIGAQC